LVVCNKKCFPATNKGALMPQMSLTTGTSYGKSVTTYMRLCTITYDMHVFLTYINLFTITPLWLVWVYHSAIGNIRGGLIQDLWFSFKFKHRFYAVHYTLRKCKQNIRLALTIDFTFLSPIRRISESFNVGGNCSLLFSLQPRVWKECKMSGMFM
jgi:hypothetical protein